MIKVIFLLSALLIGPAFGLENPEGALTKVIEKYIIEQKPELAGTEIRVTFKFADKAIKELAALPDHSRLEILKLNQAFNPVGQVIFPVGATADGDAKKFFIRAQVEVFKDIIVAKHRLKRGQALAEDDLILAARDVALLPPKYYSRAAELAGSETKTNIPKDSAVFEWMVKPVPQVRRGENVLIKVKAENLEVKSEGVALEDGYLNRSIRVRRAGSDKFIDGKLVSPREVEVLL